jgi:hypothetical protein
VSCYVAAWSIERDVERIASEQPALWREVRRFNLPVKLALAAAHRVLGALEAPRTARIVALAPCRPGSPELRAISRELDAGFAKGSTDKLRVNPIYTLHAIDNLALSALSIRLENREPVTCLGGAAGQAWYALEEAVELVAAGTAEVLVFGGDQSDSSWKGGPVDAEACGAAIVLTSRPQRIRLVAVTRGDRATSVASEAQPHAARGLAAWLHALANAPVGSTTYRVPASDGDGIDDVDVTTEVVA